MTPLRGAGLLRELIIKSASSYTKKYKRRLACKMLTQFLLVWILIKNIQVFARCLWQSIHLFFGKILLNGPVNQFDFHSALRLITSNKCRKENPTIPLPDHWLLNELVLHLSAGKHALNTMSRNTQKHLNTVVLHYWNMP